MNNFETGQPVKIVADSRDAYRKLGLVGLSGRITNRIYGPREKGVLFGVSLDYVVNRYSATGCFWFLAKDLEPLGEEPEKQENEEEEIRMLPGYKTASVQFLSGPNTEKTHFYALYDDTILPNDTVVVSTGHHGLALARIVFIGGPASYVTNGREIVCRVDLSAWEDRKNRAQELQQLKEDMDERVKKYQALALYELAAEKDPSLRELLTRFKALQEG